jgi:Uma2 family endonuclease
LRALDDRHLRVTYDRGILEIMTLSHEHEGASYLLGRFVDVLTEESDLPVKAGRSTTFRRRKRQRGLEPDNCYWIANEKKVRGKTKIDLRVDPPPDLALETDITHSSLDRLAIYAVLGVPELWRFDGESLSIFILNEKGRYEEIEHSPTFPFLKPQHILRFLHMRSTHDENAIVRAFRSWVRRQRKGR